MDALLEPSAETCEWVSLENAHGNLAGAMRKVYWEGVVREIGYAIRSMQLWKDVESLPEEEDIMLRLPADAAGFVVHWGN